MDIVNWDFLKKGLLVRNTLENPEDLVLVAANTTYKKRGDLFQTYAVPASAFGGGGGGGVSLVNTAGLISGGPISTTGTITTSMTTNRLVGRYTAGAGIMQEISLGAGLTLSAGGVLSAVTGPVTSVSLETNNVVNADQTLLDLTSGPGVDVTYSGAGVVTFSSTSIPILRNFYGATSQSFVALDAAYKNLTAFSVSLLSGKKYRFKYYLTYTGNQPGIGYNFAINSTTVTFSTFFATFYNPSNNVSLYQVQTSNAFGVGGSVNATSPSNINTVPATAIIEGTIITTAAGTIYPQIAMDGGNLNSTVTFLANSYVEYFEIP
jgi:hypothetical protein